MRALGTKSLSEAVRLALHRAIRDGPVPVNDDADPREPLEVLAHKQVELGQLAAGVLRSLRDREADLGEECQSERRSGTAGKR